MTALPTIPRANRIPAKPLIGIVAGLVMASVPLFAKAAGVAILAFFAACAVRIYASRRMGRIPSIEVKILLFLAGVGAVGMTYGAVLGIEPGISVLLLLVALKLMETNSSRDFQVVTLLGYFLALCDLFFSQDFSLWLYVAVVFLVLTAGLVRFHSGGTQGLGYWRGVRLAGVMVLQAAPLIILLFLFFPRAYGGFRFQFGKSLQNMSGMSNRLSPGSISGVALSEEVAFRAEFPDGQTPSMATMYWRAAVLWHGNNLNWYAVPNLLPESARGRLGGPSIRQRISVQPHGERWLFALDRPTSDVPGATYTAGDCIQSVRPVTSTFLYEVVSRPENRELTLRPDQRNAALRKPNHASERAKKLAAGWRATAHDDMGIVRDAMAFFRDKRFVYTLNPGEYTDETGLDDFLFERRKGFCEHYAAAFATLMRLAGVPSRVVIGYHGGEFNEIGRYVIVHQSDAHAWCEVWIKDTGWIRIDPTDMIAPDRLVSGLASYLAAHPSDPAAANRVSSTMLGWREIMREFMLAWDSVNYEWDLRVLNFNEDTQRSFLYSIGLKDAPWSRILVGVAAVIVGLLALLSLYLKRPARLPSDELGRWFSRFCLALEAGGILRQPTEGPRDFGERAAKHFPTQAAAIREIIALYIQSRYAAEPPPQGAFAQAVKTLPRLDAGGKEG